MNIPKDLLYSKEHESSAAKEAIFALASPILHNLN